jgi:hypothetical protein
MRERIRIDIPPLVCHYSIMRKRPGKSRELTGIAQDALDALGAEQPIPLTEDGKNPFAVALGRKGGLKGGRVRAARMTAAERSASAKRAAEARWAKREDNH